MASRAIVLSVLVSSMAPARADLTLVARYDWKAGAADVSGFPVRHDGVLDPQASVEDGRLKVSECYGVAIGDLKEIEDSQMVLLRFEDVNLTGAVGGPTQRYSALAGGAGDETEWWVGMVVEFPPYGNRTILKFNLGGWSLSYQEIGIVVAEKEVTHFDSIEYLFDGSAPPGERIGIRWDDGPLFTAGWSEPETFRVFPKAGTKVRINYGCQADWDWLEGTLGPVSFSIGPGKPAGMQRPGDVSQDGGLGLTDAVWLLEHLFLGTQPELPCEGGTSSSPGPGDLGVADFNGDGRIDISDPICMLLFQYLGGDPPALGTGCVPIVGCPDRCVP